MSKEFHLWWLCFCVASYLSFAPIKPSSTSSEQYNDTQYPTHYYKNQTNAGQVFVNTNDETVELICSAYKKADYIKLLHMETNSTITFTQLVISSCPVPDVSFWNLSRTLNISSMKNLSFRSTVESATNFKFYHFENLDLVEILNLEANVVTLPEQIFHQMVNLKELNLANNRLQSLPVELLAPLKQLSKLNLQNNNFTTLNDAILRFAPTLTYLNFCGNSLNEISTSVLDPLTNLTILEICNNSITYLSNDVFASLERLEEINLSNNKLTNLSENLFNKCPNLKILKLNGNSVKKLPDHIFESNLNLEELDISYNQLEDLSYSLFNHSAKLSVLLLNRNEIFSIHHNPFHALTSLKKLNLSYNGLKNLDSTTFIHLKQLETLDLSFNQLTLEDAKLGELSPFVDCSNLQNLNLSHNLLTSVFDDWRMGLHNLQELDLSFNEVKNLKTQDFLFNVSNPTISFSNNPLQTINLNNLKNDFKLYEKYFQKSTVNLGNTTRSNITCDCHASSLVLYIQMKMHPAVYKLVNISSNEISCHSNKTNKKISMKEVEDTELKCLLENCTDECVCSYDSIKQAIILNCSEANLERFPERISILENTKIQLLFSNNKLKSVEGLSNFSMIGNVTNISLSHNELENIDNLFVQLPSSIEALELDNNRISYLDKNFLNFIKNNTSLKFLTLHGNPWECNCEMQEFQRYLRYHRPTLWIPQRKDILCKNYNKSVKDVVLENLCEPKSKWGTILQYIAIPGMLGLICIPLIILYYKYKRRIKMWMFTRKICLWIVTEKEIDKDKPYDAFVSFSHKDQRFVDEHLIPELEENGEHMYKLCVHHRDFIIGEYIPDQIAYSVNNSKRTIIILTPNFLQSIWARIEFRTAHLKAIKERCARIIVILLEDINKDQLDPELKSYVMMNTYVKWGDSQFWQKLRYALPHPPIKYRKNRRISMRMFREIEMKELSED